MCPPIFDTKGKHGKDDMTIKEMIQDAKDSVVSRRKHLKLLMAEKANLKKIDLSVVNSVDITECGITFWLDTNGSREAQRKLVLSVASVYNVEMEKEKSYWGDSLNVIGQTKDYRSIRIYGYVPPTCRIEEVEEEASDYELENARKQIEKAQALLAAGKKTVKQVVCA